MKILLAIVVLVLGLTLIALPVNSATKDIVCDSLRKANPEAQCDTRDPDKIFNQTVETVTQILVFIIGAISVLMIIIGGFRYVVSGGDSAGVEGAKNTILYAVIGLVVTILAQTIVVFVISRF